SQTIHSFEPVLATFERMVERTQGWPGVHHHRMALGAAPGEQAIHVGESSVLSSFIETDVWEPSGTEMVPVSTIDRMMEQLRIPRVHLLKVDTEGYEVEVLRGASQSLAAGSIDIIQVEAGFGQDTGPHVPLELLKSHVAAFGFSLLGIFNQCRAPE